MRSLFIASLAFVGLGFSSSVSAYYSYNNNSCGQSRCYQQQNQVSYRPVTVYQPTTVYRPVQAYQVQRRAVTNYYHPRRQQTRSSCSTCQRSRTYYRDNMTSYRQRTTYYNAQQPRIYQNTNRQSYSCAYRQGR